MERNQKDIVENYTELFDQIRERTESDEVAIAILQEIGKDHRSSQVREEKSQKVSEPATEKQKRFMKRLGIEFPKLITKKEASVLLDEELKALE